MNCDSRILPTKWDEWVTVRIPTDQFLCAATFSRSFQWVSPIIKIDPAVQKLCHFEEREREIYESIPFLNI